MDLIKDFFECPWCLSEIVNPVVLPCGESVCKKHTIESQEANWKCLLCDDVHKLTSGQYFPENKSLGRMLKFEMARLYFDPNQKEAKKRVEQVENLYSELKHMINEPEDYVSSFTQKYINQVDLAREEMIKIIDNACDRMKLEINSFKSDCEASLRKEASALIKLENYLNRKIQTWKEELDELVLNEPLWKEIIKEAKSAQEQIKSKINENTRELSLPLIHLPDLVMKDVWLKLSESLLIPTMKISDMRDKKSVLVRDVSKIAKSKSWESMYSKEFAVIQGFVFDLKVAFKLLPDKMTLGAYLNLKANHKRQTVELSWKINVYGKHYQLIRQRGSKHEFKQTEKGYGFNNLISIDSIMVHHAYDANEGMVRVEVVIDKQSIKVKDIVPLDSQ